MNALSMTARVWSGIDGGVDNVVAVAAQNGEESVVEFGSAIRQAGWDQVPWVNGELPPMDQVIEIRLTREQWAFASEQSRQSLPFYDEVGYDESAQLYRDTFAVIEPALG